MQSPPLPPAPPSSADLGPRHDSFGINILPPEDLELPERARTELPMRLRCKQVLARSLFCLGILINCLAFSDPSCRNLSYSGNQKPFYTSLACLIGSAALQRHTEREITRLFL